MVWLAWIVALFIAIAFTVLVYLLAKVIKEDEEAEVKK